MVDTLQTEKLDFLMMETKESLERIRVAKDRIDVEKNEPYKINWKIVGEFANRIDMVGKSKPVKEHQHYSSSNKNDLSTSL